jgi:hypothetical protein
MAAAAILSILTACAATTSGTNDDATISTRVKIALLGDQQTQLLRLDVRTFQGVVTLSGPVPSAAAKQRAIAVARTIKGVKDVKSEITVSGGEASGSQHSAVSMVRFSVESVRAPADE